MDFSTLQSEVFRRGFDYLSDAGTGLASAKRWINEAYHEINEAEDWPYLVVTSAGAAPLTITDARKVLSVVDTVQAVQLTGTTQRALLRVFASVATAGTAEWWWHDTAGTAVKIYPTSVNNISVTYLKVPVDLSAGGDTPIVPARYHELIVNGAVRRAYEDSDNYEAAAGVQREIDAGINQMRIALLRPEPGRDPVGPHHSPLKAGEIAE